MKEYTHKDIPELQAQIQYLWHKEHRDDNFTLLHNRRVILTNVKDSEIENSRTWILTFDSEAGGKDERDVGDICADSLERR